MEDSWRIRTALQYGTGRLLIGKSVPSGSSSEAYTQTRRDGEGMVTDLSCEFRLFSFRSAGDTLVVMICELLEFRGKDSDPGGVVDADAALPRYFCKVKGTLTERAGQVRKESRETA